MALLPSFSSSPSPFQNRESGVGGHRFYVSTVDVSIAGPYHAIIFEYIDQPNLSGDNVQSEEEMK